MLAMVVVTFIPIPMIARTSVKIPIMLHRDSSSVRLTLGAVW